MRVPLPSLLKLLFKVESYLKTNPASNFCSEGEDYNEFSLEIAEIEKEVEKTKAKARKLRTRLIDLLKEEDYEQIVDRLVQHEIERFNEKTKNDVKWNIEMIKEFIQKIIDKIALLQSYDSVKPNNPIAQNLEAFLATPNNQIMKSNYFLTYILEIQTILTVKDIRRLIGDFIIKKNVETGALQGEDPSQYIFKGTSKKSQALEYLFEEHGPELSSKFSHYTSEEDDSVAYVCDFLSVLRVFMQDQKRLSLHLPTEVEQKITIFRSITATKIIQEKIEEFYYKVLRIDPELEGNGKFDLRMNMYLFKKIAIYMLRTDSIVLVDSELPQSQLSEDGGLDSMNAGKVETLFKKINFNIAGFSRISENDFSLTYKLMWIMKELRISMENTLVPEEKTLCVQIIESISENIKNSANPFSSKVQDGTMSPRSIIESILNLHDIYIYFQNVSHEGFSTESEKFWILFERLEIGKLAPRMNKRQIIVLFKRALPPQSMRIDFKIFTDLFENVCMKIHRNRDVQKRTLTETISDIMRRFEVLRRDEYPRPMNSLSKRINVMGDNIIIPNKSNKALSNSMIDRSPIKKLDDKGYEPLFSVIYTDKKRDNPIHQRKMSTLIPTSGRYRISGLSSITPLVVGKRIKMDKS